MNESKVTIILTSYNRPKYLKQAIESVLAQTYQNWELFIMDDNSVDEVNDIIMRFVQADSRIHYHNSHISKEERQTTGCRYAHLINLAIKMSKGEYISYLVDDDFYYPDRLKVMVEYLDKHKDVSVVYGWQQKIQVDKQGNERLIDIRRPGGIIISASCTIDHNSIMHRRACLEKTGLWPLNDLRCGDAGFWTKLNENGFDFYPIEMITDAKRYHPFTISDKLDRGEDPLTGIREP